MASKFRLQPNDASLYAVRLFTWLTFGLGVVPRARCRTLTDAGNPSCRGRGNARRIVGRFHAPINRNRPMVKNFMEICSSYVEYIGFIYKSLYLFSIICDRRSITIVPSITHGFAD
jgi:hypothetical protein